ncbi:MAG: GtrA family protein [Candidatus Paceibacterota bacterium]
MNLIKKILSSKYAQIIRYIFAGGTVTATNLVIFFICVQYFKLWYLTSAIISFCFAVIMSYVLQKFFVFNNYSKEKIHKQFLIFLIFNIFMLGVNTILMYTFVEIMGFWYLLAQTLSSAICAFVNYIYFNKIIFKNV